LWVEAKKVVEATKGGAYVHVTAYGVEYRMCRREWNNPVFDKTRSDTLVQDAEGSWLRIWSLEPCNSISIDISIQPTKYTQSLVSTCRTNIIRTT